MKVVIADIIIIRGDSFILTNDLFNSHELFNLS